MEKPVKRCKWCIHFHVEMKVMTKCTKDPIWIDISGAEHFCSQIEWDEEALKISEERIRR